MARRTLPADTQDTACSVLRPPKTTATRGLRRGGEGLGSVMVGQTSPAGHARPDILPCMSPAQESALSSATVVVSAGRPPRQPDGPLNPPLVLASTYHAGGEVGYGRYGNPTWEMFESAVAALEGGVATSFASGLAAVSAVLDLVPEGGVVVAPPDAYYGSLELLARLEKQGRLTVRSVDLTDLSAADEALRDAALVWVETPTNPMLKVVDVAALSPRGLAAAALLVVDSTCARPVLARPLEAGADIVVHSAAKFLSGHSDVVLGVA